MPQGAQGHNLSLIGMSIGGDANDPDNQTKLTTPTAISDSQGASQGAKKQPNPDSASSFMSRRRLAKVVTSLGTLNPLKPLKSQNVSYLNREKVFCGACELDLHADKSVAGPNCTVLEYTNQSVNVSGFSHEYKSIRDVPIVTAATAIDNPKKGVTTILIIGQALYLPDKVTFTLLCPNQIRSNGLIVDDVPIHLAPCNYPLRHAIYIQDDETIQVPLQLKECISYFESRTPTQEEGETCQWVYLTDGHHWEPHSDFFQEAENNAIKCIENDTPRDRNLFAVQKSVRHVIHDGQDQLSSALSYSSVMSYSIHSTSTSSRCYQLSPELLSQRWGMGLETTKNKIKVTTQKRIRSTLYPIE
jgi:hypothetical protein